MNKRLVTILLLIGTGVILTSITKYLPAPALRAAIPILTSLAFAFALISIRIRVNKMNARIKSEDPGINDASNLSTNAIRALLYLSVLCSVFGVLLSVFHYGYGIGKPIMFFGFTLFASFIILLFVLIIYSKNRGKKKS